MHTEDLAHLDWLSRIDALREQLRQWKSTPIEWEPLRPAQALVGRLLDRMEPLRIRWEAPLVVATFGGTGTGKSSLVNALVGEPVTTVGKERPTTRRPRLVCHPEIDPVQTRISLDEVDVTRCDRPLLRDFLLLDCPDPDTSESDGVASNLRRLHELLPACDVLLYVSTQQKYRSARVGDELGKAADSCRLVFVQTHADLDSDIRDDWRQQLEPDYRIAEMFFVDSRRALLEQQQGLHPTGDFGRLLTFCRGNWRRRGGRAFAGRICLICWTRGCNARGSRWNRRWFRWVNWKQRSRHRAGRWRGRCRRKLRVS
ncbi:MAG: GTPase domain-containing protein [Planctomycetaceae bacterium]